MPRANPRRWLKVTAELVLKLGRQRVGRLRGTGYWPGGQIEFTCPRGPSLRVLFADSLGIEFENCHSEGLRQGSPKNLNPRSAGKKPLTAWFPLF